VIDIEALKVGDVVQLVSGSPYMAVRGFKPVVPVGQRNPGRTHVTCIIWSHRHGFLKEDFRPEELRVPPPRWTTPDAASGGSAAE
jgi:uncharacterized protein YodC (DUF2158 family)